ncbi:TIGR01459 family HAD-type hydrolase [Pelagibius marinus]|uniref:TIGR01459 family HAD-type hydrolase n=1 Tax=Pelagibius marinus TaxID=2762760 RepID=UPI001872E125|nr:TIGR01459 family HAD-type hydrolase [Pelagibius marinus]
MTARLLDGLAALAARYDAYLLDQFGVLHDGTNVYPGVLDCLEALKEAGKRVVILSNSGTRREANRERLAGLGIPSALYEDFVTSGEVTRAYLNSAPAELRAENSGGGALRCLPLVGASERAILAGLNVAEAASVEEADFVMVASFGQEPPPRGAFDDVLAAARRRGLTLVCANPDVKGVSPKGLIHAPGAVAADYEAAGGKVVYIGKPHPLIYRHVLQNLSPVPPSRVLAVGDSLSHDIAGAQGVGIASALVIEGIHQEELGDPGQTQAFDSRLAALERRYHAQADYLLRRLAW